MQLSTVLDIAIIAIPTCYAAWMALDFVSGLAKIGKRYTPPAVPQSAPAASEQPLQASETALEAPQETAMIATASAQSTAPASDTVKAVPLAPIPQETTPTGGQSDSKGRRTKSQGKASTSAHKPQERHPALKGMSLRTMRQLGAELQIKGARRWNTAQALAALGTHYQKNNA